MHFIHYYPYSILFFSSIYHARRIDNTQLNSSSYLDAGMASNHGVNLWISHHIIALRKRMQGLPASCRAAVVLYYNIYILVSINIMKLSWKQQQTLVKKIKIWNIKNFQGIMGCAIYKIELELLDTYVRICLLSWATLTTCTGTEARVFSSSCQAAWSQPLNIG